MHSICARSRVRVAASQKVGLSSAIPKNQLGSRLTLSEYQLYSPNTCLSSVLGHRGDPKDSGMLGCRFENPSLPSSDLKA